MKSKAHIDIPRHTTGEVLDPSGIEVISFEELYLQKIAQETIYDDHRASFYHIFRYGDSGGEHYIQGQRIKMKKNSLLIVNKDIWQRYSEYKCTGDIVLFSTASLGFTQEKNNFLRRCTVFRNDYAIISPRSEDFIATIDMYFSLMKIRTGKFQETAMLVLHNWVYKLLMTIEREYRLQERRLVSIADTGTYVQQFRALLEMNYQTQKQLHFYAEKLDISEKKLSRIVFAVHGISAKEYINEKVLTEAIRLLKNTTLNQGEIADELGLDFSYFVRFFRKHLGVTPAKYRQQDEIHS
jgi:AraC-like DNA-binding protein